MMMIHRIVLKTHPLFDDTRSFRPFCALAREKYKKGAPIRAKMDGLRGLCKSPLRLRAGGGASSLSGRRCARRRRTRGRGLGCAR
jgi:hypothetical protein